MFTLGAVQCLHLESSSPWMQGMQLNVLFPMFVFTFGSTKFRFFAPLVFLVLLSGLGIFDRYSGVWLLRLLDTN